MRFFSRRVLKHCLLAPCLIVLVACSLLQPGGPVLEPGTAMASPDHPRLLFGATDVATLRTQTATTHSAIWEPLVAFTASLHGVQPAPVPPAGAEQTDYRNAGDTLIALAFVCLVSDDIPTCDQARAYLLTYTAWPTWDVRGQRLLGHAHLLLGSALAYDWLYQRLTPTERVQVRDRLAARADEMYQASIADDYNPAWDNWWRASYIQNHYWILHGALGVAGLALLDDDQRAAVWVAHAAQKSERLRDLLDAAGDGTWHESIHYQNYGFTQLLPFLVNLRHIQGVDLIPHNYFRNYPLARLYSHLPNGQFILTYGDFDFEWAPEIHGLNLLRFAAAETGDGRAEWLARHLAASGGRRSTVWTAPWYVFEFLYYNPQVRPVEPHDLPLNYTLPDLGAVIWRTGWDRSATIFALKSGAPGGRTAYERFIGGQYPWDPPCSETGCQFNVEHEHDDANTFYLFSAGQWLAPESAGVGKSATSFHNTLLISNAGQYRPSATDFGADPDPYIDTDGFFEAISTTYGFSYLAADATRRYQNVIPLNDFTRHVLFVRPGYFVMLDNLLAGTPLEYSWISHFGESVTVADRWVRGTSGSSRELGVAIVAPERFKTVTGDDGRPYVRISPAEPVADTRLIHVLYPTTTSAWERRPLVSLVADNGAAAAVEVVTQTGERRETTLITYATPDGPLQVGPYRYDGRAAFIRRTAAGSVTAVFLTGATFLADAERTLVSGLDASDDFEATFVYGVVCVDGSFDSRVSLYAPNARELYVNGFATPFDSTGNVISFTSGEPSPDAAAGPTNPCFRPASGLNMVALPRVHY